MNRKKCKYKGCTNPVWAGGLCQNHIKRKPLPKMNNKLHYVSKKGNDLLNKAIVAEFMHEFFMQIWNERKHRSEVSGTPLGKEALSTFFHHILPKSKYWDAALDPENIILLTPDEHGNVESNMYLFEEVNRRRELLLKKYNLI